MVKRYGSEQDWAERKELIKGAFVLGGLVLFSFAPAIYLSNFLKSLEWPHLLVDILFSVTVIFLLIWGKIFIRSFEYKKIIYLRWGEVFGLLRLHGLESAMRGVEVGVHLIKELKIGESLSRSIVVRSPIVSTYWFRKDNLRFADQMADLLLESLLYWIEVTQPVVLNPSNNEKTNPIALYVIVNTPGELIKLWGADPKQMNENGTVVKRAVKIWVELVRKLSINLNSLEAAISAIERIKKISNQLETESNSFWCAKASEDCKKVLEYVRNTEKELCDRFLIRLEYFEEYDHADSRVVKLIAQAKEKLMIY